MKKRGWTTVNIERGQKAYFPQDFTVTPKTSMVLKRGVDKRNGNVYYYIHYIKPRTYCVTVPTYKLSKSEFELWTDVMSTRSKMIKSMNSKTKLIVTREGGRVGLATI